MSLDSFFGEEDSVGETRPVFPWLDLSFLVSFSRGRVFLKILTMSRLMGNMMMELWIPIMTCCHVNSIWPAKRIEFWVEESEHLSTSTESVVQSLDFIRNGRCHFDLFHKGKHWLNTQIGTVVSSRLFYCQVFVSYQGPWFAQRGQWGCPRTWCWSTWCRAAGKNSKRRAAHE